MLNYHGKVSLMRESAKVKPLAVFPLEVCLIFTVALQLKKFLFFKSCFEEIIMFIIFIIIALGIVD